MVYKLTTETRKQLMTVLKKGLEVVMKDFDFVDEEDIGFVKDITDILLNHGGMVGIGDAFSYNSHYTNVEKLEGINLYEWAREYFETEMKTED